MSLYYGRYQIYDKAIQALLDLITPDCIWSPHNTKKMIPYSLNVNSYRLRGHRRFSTFSLPLNLDFLLFCFIFRLNGGTFSVSDVVFISSVLTICLFIMTITICLCLASSCRPVVRKSLFSLIFHLLHNQLNVIAYKIRYKLS